MFITLALSHSWAKIDVWVDPVNGFDQNNGTRSFPFQSLQRAQQAARIGGAGSIVHLKAGNYPMARNQTLQLSMADSGISWIGDGSGPVILDGGLRVDSPWNLATATDSPGLPAQSLVYVFSA